MMKMINNFLNRLRTPIPIVDRILEIVAGVCVIALFVTTAIFYNLSPEEVPTHYSFSGEADEYSGNSFYWLMSGLFFIFMLITYISAYYPNSNSVRLPIRSKEMTPLQMMLVARMTRIINIGLAFLWLDVLLSISASTLNIEWDTIRLINISSVIVITIPAIWYTIKIMHNKN